MNFEQIVSAPEEDLATVVLRQAGRDLRRFHQAAGVLERELYLDAYRWITDSDFTWPYSFVNICKHLDVQPETLRAELLPDASLGWLGYWCKLGARFCRPFRASLSRAIKKSRNGHIAAIAPEPAQP